MLAVGTVESVFGDVELAEGARSQVLGRVFSFDRPSGNAFDSGFEFWWDLVDIFRSDEDACLLVGLLLKGGLGALTDACGHDVGHVLRELGDVLANSDEESGCAHVIAHLDLPFGQLVGMEEDETLRQFIRNTLSTFPNILECVKHDLMCVLVVAKLLFFLRNIDGNFDCLVDISDGTVEFECPLRLLGNIIGLSEQIVDELVSQSIHLYLSNHLDHIWNDTLTLLDVQFECLRVLFTPLIMLSSTTPLVLTLVILGNLHVFVDTSVIN